MIQTVIVLENMANSIDYTKLKLSELNELLKKGEVQIFTEAKLSTYKADLRKCYDNDEISRESWLEELKSVETLIKCNVSNEDDVLIHKIYIKLNNTENESNN